MLTLETINRQVVRCTRCPELRRYCAEVGRTKRRAYADQTYWARPVPGFGDPDASIMIVGLAPAAHGANRTGRMFTGDRSGDFLFAALHRVGLANQAEAVSRDDGLVVNGVYITAPVRCAPPGNKPTAEQRRRCLPYLEHEMTALRPRVIVCLGSIGWAATMTALRAIGADVPRPRPRFGHAAEYGAGFTTVLGSYHVSQQNTFTGRLTEQMLASVLERAKKLAA